MLQRFTTSGLTPSLNLSPRSFFHVTSQLVYDNLIQILNIIGLQINVYLPTKETAGISVLNKCDLTEIDGGKYEK